MTEINKPQNVNFQNTDLTLQSDRTQTDETEDLNVFGGQSDKKDIGDIHGVGESHKYGTINNTNFDIRVDFFNDINGQVNGKNVKLDYKPHLLAHDEYVGQVGDKQVHFEIRGVVFSSSKNYEGNYGDTKFSINYKDSIRPKISGKFGNQEVNIEIDENLFEADDILTTDNLPKDMEEFFPVLYTVMNYEHEKEQAAARRRNSDF